MRRRRSALQKHRKEKKQKRLGAGDSSGVWQGGNKKNKKKNLRKERQTPGRVKELNGNFWKERAATVFKCELNLHESLQLLLPSSANA